MLHQFSILLHPATGKVIRRRSFRDGEASAAAGGGSPAASAASQAAPPAAPPASATGIPSTTPPPAAASTPPPVDDIQQGNWQQLRAKYDAAQARAKALDAFGVPEDRIGTVATQYKAIMTTVNTLGKELGYEDADLAEAFATDPVKTLSLLQQEKAEAEAEAARANATQRPGESNEDFMARVRDMVRKEMEPATKHINQQITDAVMAKVDTTFDAAFKAALPDAPAEVRSLIEDYVYESLQHSKDNVAAMRNNGDFSSVETQVQFVAGRLKDVFAKWVAHEQTRTQNGRPRVGDSSTGTTQQQNGKRPSLDDMINDPGLINAKYR